MSRHWLMGCLLACNTQLAEAACKDKLEEFSLLVHMKLVTESAALYGELLAQCRTDLHGMLGNNLPNLQQQEQWLALGNALYQNRKIGSSQQALAALYSGNVPQIDSEALQGIGPDNMGRALAGLALDSVAVDSANRGKYQEAVDLRKLADYARGDEKRWLDMPTTSSVSSVSGGTVSPQIRVAEQKSFNFGANCPVDSSGVRSDISHPVVSGHLNEPILDIARRFDGYDMAIAMFSAQKEESLSGARSAAQQAHDSWGGGVRLYDINPCRNPSGIYCAGVYQMWMESDMAIVAQYIMDALTCHKNKGSEL